MLFDTHVHLQAHQYKDDIKDVIDRALQNNVTKMLIVGFDAPTIEEAIRFAEEYDFIYAAVGWHPVDAIHMTEENFNRIEELMVHPKVVALGEIGLDYYWKESPKEIQKDVFIRQIHLAKKYNKPIIIHNRDATQDVYELLKRENAKDIGGIMHCYSSSAEMAKEFVKLNFHISLGGPLTFKNGRMAKEVCEVIPMEYLLVETDCPYLSPEPFRGKRNEPAYVSHIVAEMARIKGLTFDQVATQTRQNAEKLLKIR